MKRIILAAFVVAGLLVAPATANAQAKVRPEMPPPTITTACRKVLF